MKIDLETYLHVICNDWAFSSSRFTLELPFVYLGWKIATDGRILLAIPTDEQDTLESDQPRRRFPPKSALLEILKQCQASWDGELSEWPSITSDKAIAPMEEEDDGLYAIVLNWDREVVVDARFYWIFERLAIAFDSRVECRFPEEDTGPPMFERHNIIQFRSSERDDKGRYRFIGQLMPLDHQRHPSAVAAIELYKKAKKASEEA
jgi:hypothetical protein